MTTAIAQYDWSKTQSAAAQDAFISGTKNLLLAAGLVQTTDTGQVTTPVTSATALGTTAGATLGFLVFKFPDALQATMPIFIRVDFNNDSGPYGIPVAKFSVSSTTNGAGALGTPSFLPPNPAAQNGNISPGLSNYASYSDGTFACVLGYAGNPATSVNNNCVGALIVDRARSATGVAQGAGYLCEAPWAFNTLTYSRAIYGPASPATQNYIPSLPPSQNATSSSDGATANVYRHHMAVPSSKPSLGSLTYYTAEFGALAPVTVTVLGASHTYLPMGLALNPWAAFSAFDVNTATRFSGMIRWE